MYFIAIIVLIILIIKVNSLSSRIEALEKSSQNIQVAPVVVAVTPNITTVPEPVAQPVAFKSSIPVYIPPVQGDEIKAGTWFAGIGALALVMALGFLLRYAFVHNIITEPLRVILGFVGGGILLTLGYYFRNKYKEYAGILAGAGLGLMYVSAYSAHASYQLISYPAALILLLIINLIGIVGSSYVKSGTFAVWSLVGAYITPMIMGNVDSNLLYFLAYITTLNLYSVATAIWNKWSGVIVTNLIGTFSLFYLLVPFSDANVQSSSVFLVINFIIFFAASLIRYMKDRTALQEGDHMTSAGSAIMFYVSLYLVLYKTFNAHELGLMTFAFALFYAVLWFVIKSIEEKPSYYRYQSGAFALGFFTLAVPVAFDYSTVTLFWGIEAVIFGLIATRIGSSIAAFFSTTLFLFVTYRIVVVDRLLNVNTNDTLREVFMLNKTFLSSMLVMLLMVFMIFLYNMSRNAFKDEKVSIFSDMKPRSHINTLVSLSSFLLVTVFTLEFDLFNKSTDFLPLIYIAISVIALYMGIKFGSLVVRTLSYILAFIAVIQGYFTSFDITMPFFNERILMSLVYAGFVFVISYIVYVSPRNEIAFTEMDIMKPISNDERNFVSKVGFISANIIALASITREITYYFTEFSNSASRVNAMRVSISVTWLMYGFGLLVLGIAKKLIAARSFSVVLLSVVIIKIFLFDTSGLTDIYRFMAYGFLGVILLIVGFLYNKYKDRISGFIKGEQI